MLYTDTSPVRYVQAGSGKYFDPVLYGDAPPYTVLKVAAERSIEASRLLKHEAAMYGLVQRLQMDVIPAIHDSGVFQQVCSASDYTFKLAHG